MISSRGQTVYVCIKQVSINQARDSVSRAPQRRMSMTYMSKMTLSTIMSRSATAAALGLVLSLLRPESAFESGFESAFESAFTSASAAVVPDYYTSTDQDMEHLLNSVRTHSFVSLAHTDYHCGGVCTPFLESSLLLMEI
jgi:hypothetical protein